MTILRRAPGISLAAALMTFAGTFTLGCALCLAHGLILRPLLLSMQTPVGYIGEVDESDPERLRRISYPAFLAWERATGCSTSVSVEKPVLLNISSGETSWSEMVGLVSPTYFSTRGIAPERGADLARELGAVQAILSQKFSSRIFVENPVGRIIKIGDIPVEVVGVAPPALNASRLSAWLDLRHFPTLFPGEPDPQNSWAAKEFRGLVRLSDRCSEDQFSEELAQVSRELRSSDPTSQEGTFLGMEMLYARTIRRALSPVAGICGAAAISFILAAFNLGILLAREHARRREDFRTRAFLGVTFRRLASSTTLEIGFLVSLGVAAALLTFPAAIPWLEAAVPQGSFGPGVGRSVGEVGYITIGLSGLVLLLAATSNSLLRLRRSWNTSFRTSRSGQARSRWTGRWIVFVQVSMTAAAIPLAASIFLSYRTLGEIELGFEPEQVVAFGVSLPADRFAHQDRRAQFFDTALANIEEIAGVAATSVSLDLPLQGASCWESVTPGGEATNGGVEVPCQLIGPRYFEVLGVPLIHGEVWERGTHPYSTRDEVVVNATLAKQLFPEQNSIVGETIALSQGAARIIGVVGDVQQEALQEKQRGVVYFPGYGSFMQVLVRGYPQSQLKTEEVRLAVARTDSGAAFYSERALVELQEDHLSNVRALAALIGLAALFCLAVGVVGVYATVAQEVRSRHQELFMRMALGGSPYQVAARLMLPAAGIALVGIAAGSMLFVAFRPLIESVLFGAAQEPGPLVLTGAACIAATILFAATLPLIGLRNPRTLAQLVRVRPQ